MIATSGKKRAHVAAEIYERDYDHLTSRTDCLVRIKRYKAEAVVCSAGWNMPFLGKMDLSQISIAIPADADVRSLMSVAMSNKRLTALIDPARATGAAITFANRGPYIVDVGIKCDITATEGRSPEALDAAARWMRIEHNQAVNQLMGKARGECPGFRIDYPSDPAECIKAVETSFIQISHWVHRTIMAATYSENASMATVLELLNSIQAKRLTKGEAKRLNEARAIVGKLLKTA